MPIFSLSHTHTLRQTCTYVQFPRWYGKYLAISNHQLGSTSWFPWLQQEKQILANLSKRKYSGWILEAHRIFGNARSQAWEWIGNVMFSASVKLRLWELSHSHNLYSKTVQSIVQQNCTIKACWNEGTPPAYLFMCHASHFKPNHLIDSVWVRWLPLG